jgi:hypothetical protein
MRPFAACRSASGEREVAPGPLRRHERGFVASLDRAVRGNALATFPLEAFEDDVVVHLFLGHRQVHFQST